MKSQSIELVIPQYIVATKQTLYDVTYVESKTAKLMTTETRIVVTRPWEMGDVRRCWSKGTNFQLFDE